MCQKLLGDATLYALLMQIDTDLAAKAREGRCLLCGGPLHQSNYPRKPRGGSRHRTASTARPLPCAMAGAGTPGALPTPRSTIPRPTPLAYNISVRFEWDPAKNARNVR